MRLARWLFTVLALVPGIAWAQPVDVGIEGVQATPAAPRADEMVTVRATVRRHAGKAPSPKAAVDVEVEFALVSEGGPFATRRLSLGPDQTAQVDSSWKARPGQHVFRVRIARVILNGQLLPDPNPANNKALSPTVLVRAAESKPEPRIGQVPPGPTPAVPAPAPGSPLPAPVVPLPPGGAIAGVLTVPADLGARYRVTVEGPGGLSRTVEAAPSGERRPYRVEGLPPGSYRVTPEAVPASPAAPVPAEGWSPRQQSLALRAGERLEGVRGVDFAYAPRGLARGLPAGAGPARSLPLPSSPRADRRPVDLPIELRVDGGLFAEVSLPRAVVLEWRLPPEATGDAVEVAVRASESWSSGGSPWEGTPRTGLPTTCFIELAGHPAGCFPHPLSDALPGFDRAGRATAPGVPRGTLTVDVGSARFPVGAEYEFSVSYQVAGEGLPRWTNPVHVVKVRSPLDTVLGGPAAPTTVPDLVVTTLDWVRTGSDAGRVLLVVGTASGRPAAGTVAYQLFDETRLTGPVLVEEGTMPIASAGLGSVLSRYRLPEWEGARGSFREGIIRAVVNADGAYPEARRDNNSMEKIVGGDRAYNRVHDVWKEAEGPLWTMLAVRYSARDEGLLGNLYSLIVSVPFPGEPGERRVRCVSRQGLERLALREPEFGRNLVAFFLCFAPPLPGPVTTRSVVTDVHLAGATGRHERAFAVEKAWRPDLALLDRGPALPDLDVTVLATARSSDLREAPRGGQRHFLARAVLVRVHNVGAAAAPAHHVRVNISTVAGAGSGWDVGWEGRRDVPRLDPGQSADLCFAVDGQIWISPTGSSVARAALEGLRVVQRSMDNNRATRGFSPQWSSPTQAVELTADDRRELIRCLGETSGGLRGSGFP